MDTSSTSSRSDKQDPPEALRPDPLLSNKSKERSNIYLHIFSKIQNVRFAGERKLQELFAYANLENHVLRPDKLGDIIAADHKIFNVVEESRNSQMYAIWVQDLATQWIQNYPCKTKTSQEKTRHFRKFFDLEDNPKVIYVDNSQAF